MFNGAGAGAPGAGGGSCMGFSYPRKMALENSLSQSEELPGSAPAKTNLIRI